MKLLLRLLKVQVKQAKLEPTRGGKTLVLDYNKTPALK